MKHSCLILLGACGILLAFPHFQGFHTLFHHEEHRSLPTGLPETGQNPQGLGQNAAPVFQLWNGGPRGLVRANASSSVGRKRYVKWMVKDWSKATQLLQEIVFGGAGVRFDKISL